MLHRYQNLTKEELVTRLVYFIYLLGFIAVVGSLLCLIAMLFGINPKEHVAIIGCAVGGAWYRKQQELIEEAKKQNDKKRNKVFEEIDNIKCYMISIQSRRPARNGLVFIHMG